MSFKSFKKKKMFQIDLWNDRRNAYLLFIIMYANQYSSKLYPADIFSMVFDTFGELGNKCN